MSREYAGRVRSLIDDWTAAASGTDVAAEAVVRYLNLLLILHKGELTQAIVCAQLDELGRASVRAMDSLATPRGAAACD